MARATSDTCDTGSSSTLTGASSESVEKSSFAEKNGGAMRGRSTTDESVLHPSSDSPGRQVSAADCLAAVRTDRWSCRECHPTRLSDEGNRLGGISEEGVELQLQTQLQSYDTAASRNVTKSPMPSLSARKSPPRSRSRQSVTRRGPCDNAHLPAKLGRECSRVQTAPSTKCCTKTKTSAMRSGGLDIQRPGIETKTSPVEPDSGASSGG